MQTQNSLFLITLHSTSCSFFLLAQVFLAGGGVNCLAFISVSKAI